MGSYAAHPKLARNPKYGLQDQSYLTSEQNTNTNKERKFVVENTECKSNPIKQTNKNTNTKKRAAVRRLKMLYPPTNIENPSTSNIYQLSREGCNGGTEGGVEGVKDRSRFSHRVALKYKIRTPPPKTKT